MAQPKSPADREAYLLQSQAQLLEHHLDIQTRQSDGHSFSHCFIGHDAIAVIQKLKFANSDQEAVAYGNQLYAANLIEHVSQEHSFKNEDLLYQFTQHYHTHKIESSSSSQLTHHATASQRTPFYLIESDHETCSVPSKSDAITQISAFDSLTKLEYGIKWTQSPKTCVLIKKRNDKYLSHVLLEMATWLRQQKNITVYIESAVREKESEFASFSVFNMATIKNEVDFIVVLGGDGTLLWATSLFQGAMCVPPVISFGGGSLGFLTPFDLNEYKPVLSEFTSTGGPHWVNIRMRLRAKVFRCKTTGAATASDFELETKQCWPYNVEQDSDAGYKCVYDKHALNEVLIERTATLSAMIMLNLHVNRKQVTYVQSDGLIISTPTGSTAYSVSAGGSLIAPNVPCIGLTPICPHTLSFRPVVVNDSSIIHITIPSNARTFPKITLDGKFPFQLQQSDVIEIKASKYPLPTYKQHQYQHEWFNGLLDKFKWNVRQQQN